MLTQHCEVYLFSHGKESVLDNTVVRKFLLTAYDSVILWIIAVNFKPNDFIWWPKRLHVNANKYFTLLPNASQIIKFLSNNVCLRVQNPNVIRLQDQCWTHFTQLYFKCMKYLQSKCHSWGTLLVCTIKENCLAKVLQ